MRWGGNRFDEEVYVDVVSVDPAAQLQAQLDPQGKSLDVKKSAAEKRFLLKLDICLMTYGCLSCVCQDARADAADRSSSTSTRPTSIPPTSAE